MSPEESDEEEFRYPDSGISGAPDEEVGDKASVEPAVILDSEEEEAAEEFVYPGAGNEALSHDENHEHTLSLPTPPSFEPGAELELPSVPLAPPSEVVVQPPVTIISSLPQASVSKIHPTPTQLETIQTAAANADLSKLQELFRDILKTGDFEAFALANDASPKTGLTALHAAASRGRLDAVKWRMYCHMFYAAPDV
jgi:hypothetical protein